jgi:hypothetical protein
VAMIGIGRHGANFIPAIAARTYPSQACLHDCCTRTLLLAGVNFSSSATVGNTLPREVIVPIAEVAPHFPDIA